MIKGVPVFIEGSVFSMEIPISQKINEGAFEGASRVVATKLLKLIQIIANHQGYRSPEIQVKSELTQKTLERYLKQLREYGMIEYRGDATQTGGYFLTEKSK